MTRLIALRADGARFAAALARTWDAGDAVLPVDWRLPDHVARDLTHRLGAGEEIDAATALVVATSGTTGQPKGVVLSHAQVTASARATSSFLRVEPEHHRWLACLPLAHVGGLSVLTRALLTGTPVDVHDRFDAAAVDAAAASGCTHVSLVATAMRRISTRAWTKIVLGGSAPPADRPPNSVATYGLTETGSGVVYDGTPLDGVEIAVRDEQILVRGPMVSTTYRDGSAVTDADGWLHTGDVGAWDGSHLEVFGRADDMIITGGENVRPDPVEARLRLHPGIADAAVVGRADAEWGQRVVAVVEVARGTPEPTLADVRAWVRESLPAWCAPKEIEVRATLPRTALGKIRRAELR